MMRRHFVRPIALVCLLATLSCNRRPENDARHFRFINRGDIFTLDLNHMSYSQDFRLTYAIREGLYAPVGKDFSPLPAGATGVDISADKRVYTFHLRPECRWSNGDPVRASDYAFSWRLMLENPGDYTYLFFPIQGAEQYKTRLEHGEQGDFSTVGVKVLDPLTLQVSLSEPVAYFLDLVAFPPFYPRHEPSMRPFAKTDPVTGRTTYDDHYTRPPYVVTNGPFSLTDWEFKRVLRLKRNPYYWDSAHVKLDAIDNVVNENTLSQYLQFEAGAVDFVSDVPGDIGPELRQQKLPGLQVGTSFGTFFLTLNCSDTLPNTILNGAKNPMADVRVRQAMAMSIDKDFITREITRMGERAADLYIPPGTLPGYTSLPGLHHDVEKARQLLAEAGYPDGRGFPKLPILFNSENSTRGRIAQALKQQWKQTLGIDIEIEGIEGKIFHQRCSSKQYAIATVSWFGDYPDVSTFTDKYSSDSLNNDSAWYSPAYDALLAKAAQETDAQKRFGLLQRAEQMINTQVPIIPIYYYVNAILVGPHTRGISVNPRSMIDWKQVSLESGR